MATKRKTTKKAAKKAPAKKKAAKKATAKKKAVKKAAAKKTTKKPTKKTAAKKAAKKTTKKKVSKKTVKKAAAKKTTKKKAPAKKKAAKKAPAKKTAAKKATKKKAAKKKVVIDKEKAKQVAKALADKKKARRNMNVGQAPRTKTVAASIPIPTQLPPKETPQADAKVPEDAEAASNAKQDFKVNDRIVYPAHGVGKIVGLEKQNVAGVGIELFVIDFDQEKMKLRVPTGKAKMAGMRELSSEKVIKNSIDILKGRARIKRTMWSRRAQEYDAKINSGEIKLVAEVVRDLFRASDQPEQSYSERQLFEAALDRMAREVAAVRKVDLGKAIEDIEFVLNKKAAAAAKAAAKAEEEAAEKEAS
ncbi:MAG: CarD family transcriptional regulator [Marinicaulis sp.]|nr:CarD family transcriptional regulator [Marinicaulis sp.]